MSEGICTTIHGTPCPTSHAGRCGTYIQGVCIGHSVETSLHLCLQAVPKTVRAKTFVPLGQEGAGPKAKGKGKEKVAPEAMESNLLGNMEMGVHRPDLERTTTDMVCL